ncbi:MAG: cyclic lactone autoinducer peptide [Butyribacter sp.]|nr:cyclic lactone autoinducer peptide [Roseburia hominis]CCZ42840.1 unknown [Clostridium sp. CAG:122]
MVKKIKAVEKVIAKAALTTAKSNVNSVCNFFFYQSKIPEKAKKLRKF